MVEEDQVTQPRPGEAVNRPQAVADSSDLLGQATHLATAALAGQGGSSRDAQAMDAVRIDLGQLG